MTPFQPEICPLDRAILAEAAAGTGKTYSIQTLYLRLVLERQLPVESIMVVTFTKAAAAELRNRLRTILRSALDFMETGKAEDERVRNICGKIPDQNSAHTLLKAALLDFDRACIVTIHSFCQSVLTHSAFESGIPFRTDLRADSSGLVMDLFTDYFRKAAYAPDAESSYEYAGLTLFLKTPDALAGRLLRFVKSPEQKIDFEYPEDPARARQEMEEALSGLRAAFSEGTSFARLSLNGGYKPEWFSKEFETIASEKTLPADMFRMVIEFPDEADFFLKIPKKRNAGPDPAVRAALDSFLRSKLHTRLCKLKMSVRRYSISLLADAAKTVREEFRSRRHQQNFHTFDDLIGDVCERLVPGSPLLSALQTRYGAGIVDEFQDTDSRQYAIFRRIFIEGRKDTPFFMVGDPRQAIYSFRGGDIYSYYAAKAECPEENRFSLLANYRSAPALVESVNRLFDPSANPFADPLLRPEGSIAGLSAESSLFRDGRPEQFPLRVCVLPDADALSREEVFSHSCRACAGTIVSMLKDRSLTIEGRPLRPGDFTVLCTKNSECARMLDALAEFGLPSVLADKRIVYDTPEASGLAKVLHAILSRTDSVAAADAMLTPYVGIPERLGDPGFEAAAAEAREKFACLFKAWESESFFRMFCEMMQIFDIGKRLLSTPGGERALTNMIHLRDLLTGASLEGFSAPDALLNYLERQLSENLREEASPDSELGLRLETDRPAVTIMTVHRSKGLQFPFVMLPTMFAYGAPMTIASVPDSPFHASDGTIRVSMHGIADSNRGRACLEEFQDCMRVAYVAFTRAKYGCHVFYGRPRQAPRNGFFLSVLDWLFLYRNVEIPEDANGFLTEVEKSPRQNQIPGDWIELPPPEKDARYSSREQPETPALPPWKGMSTLQWRILSYTALSPHSRAVSRVYAEERDDDDPGSGTVPLRRNAGELDPVFRVPAGDITGNAVHKILQELDFAASPEEIRSSVARNLRFFGMIRGDDDPRGIIDIVCRIIRNTLNAPLKTQEGEAFTLASAVTASSRASEMHFDMSLRPGFNSAALLDFASGYIRRKFGAEIPKTAARRTDSGIFTGAADLVFRFHDRFYIVDWKTNSIGARFNNFCGKALENEMFGNSYHLQYLIYCAAIAEYLRVRTGKSVFPAGVCYLFVRGISPDSPGRGVFQDFPAPDVIESVVNLIGGKRA